MTDEADPAPPILRRFGAAGFLALIGGAISVALRFEPPVVPAWTTWIAAAAGAVAFVLAGHGLYRGIMRGWTTAPSLVVLAAAICLVLQVWIPQLRLVPFGIAGLAFLGFMFS